MSKETKNIALFILVLLIAGLAIWYFFLREKKVEDQKASGGSSTPGGTVPPGTTVTSTSSATSTGGEVVVTITELLQAMLTGKPFAFDSKILTGQVAPVFTKNLYGAAIGNVTTGTRVIFDGSSGTEVEFFGDPDMRNVTGDPAPEKAIGAKSLLTPTDTINGIKIKNIIWITTDREYIFGPVSYGWIMGDAMRLYAFQYFVDGSEKVFPFPATGVARWIWQPSQSTKKQFKLIDTPLTQVALNTSIS